MTALAPSPMFTFGRGTKRLIPSHRRILGECRLPRECILIDLRSRSLAMNYLSSLGALFGGRRVSYITLPVPKNVGFSRGFDCRVKVPLSPVS